MEITPQTEGQTAPAQVASTQQSASPMAPKRSSINPLLVIFVLSIALFVAFAGAGIYAVMKGRGGGEATLNKETSFAGHGEYLAVIEVKGVIMESKKVLRQLKEAEEDPDIKGIVLRLNSPGGSVAPSQEIYESVKRSTKPVFATMGSVAASGAYYIAAGAKKVYANPGTLTGSIGVIMEFANLKKLYEWAKIERYSIKTGAFKDSGAEYREMAPDERAYFQSLVMDTLEQFKEAVVTGRDLKPEEVNRVADGRVFTGSQAKELRLVDELGTFQDAVDALAKELNFKGKPKLAYPAKRIRSVFDLISMGSSDENDEFEEEGSSFVDRLSTRLADRFADRLIGKNESSVIARPAGLYVLWTGFQR